MANAFEEFENLVNKQSIDRANINKDDIIGLINASLEQGEPFATEFNQKVIKPLASKIDSRIHVTPVNVDGASIGQHISQTLKDGVQKPVEEVSARLDDKFNRLVSDITSGVEKLSNQKDALAIPDIIPVKKSQQEKINREWVALQKDVIAKTKKISIPTPPALSPGKAKDSIVPPAVPKKQFRSIVEKEETVQIGGFTKDALEELSKALPLENITKITQENKLPPNWLKDLALAGTAVIAGLMGYGITGLFDTGPLKGVKKIALRLGAALVKPITKLIQRIFPNYLKNIVTNVTGAVKRLVGAPAVKTASRLITSALKVQKASTERIVKTITHFVPTFLKEVRRIAFTSIKGMLGAVKSATTKTFGKIASKNILKAPALAIGKFLAKRAKNLPLIGPIIGIGFAISRIKKGDYIGGLIDIVSGFAAMVPGLGTAVSIGLDVLNAWLDVKAGGATGEQQGAKLDILKSVVMPKLASYFKKSLRYLPGIGTIIRMGEGVEEMAKGDMLDGLLSFASAASVLVPGIGTAITGMVDAFKYQQDQEAAAPGGPLTITEKINSWIKDKLNNFFLTHIATGIFNIGMGNTKEGFHDLAKGVAWIPIIGPAYQALTNFMFGEETAPGEFATSAPVNMFKEMKKAFSQKLIDMYNKSPEWMKWIMHRVPGMAGVLENEGLSDIEIDINETDERIAEIKDKIALKQKQIEQSESGEEDVFLGSEKWGRKRAEEDIGELKEQLNELFHGHPSKKVAQDFIWRPGAGPQPFDSQDEILSVKDGGPFSDLIQAIQESNKPQDDSRKEVADNDHRRQLKEILQNIEQMVGHQAAQTGSQQQGGSPITMSGLDQFDAGSRDPAYMLRARVWNNIRTGSVML